MKVRHDNTILVVIVLSLKMTTVVIVPYWKAYFSIVIVLSCQPTMTSVVIVIFASDNSLVIFVWGVFSVREKFEKKMTAIFV